MQRLLGYLSEIPKDNIIGGNYDVEQKFFEPTFIVDVPQSAKIMQEEIFGPILPIMSYAKLDEVIEYINSKPKPLALYIFSSNKKNQDYIIQHTSSGGVVINDVLLQYVCNNLPFGGVGDSGIGAYHGEASFATFSHNKSVLNKGTWLDLDIRYPPYTPKKIKLLSSPPPKIGRTTMWLLTRVPLLLLFIFVLYLLHTKDIVVLKFLNTVA